jgi:hypothetical protein
MCATRNTGGGYIPPPVTEGVWVAGVAIGEVELASPYSAEQTSPKVAIPATSRILSERAAIKRIDLLP